MGEVVSPEKLMARREEWRREGKRVVVAAGAFDLLHPGHVRLLEQARALGEILVIAVEDDATVAAATALPDARDVSRGPVARPIVPLAERAEVLAALAAVDFVTELRNLSPADWIAQFQPDVYVQGGARTAIVPLSSESRQASDDTSSQRLIRIPLEPGYSTALLIERIQQTRQ